MTNIINPEKQKIIVVAVAALVSFLGLEAASQALQIFQIATFLRIVFYVYIFLIFWQMLVFDLHLKKPRATTGLTRTVAGALKERFEYLKYRHHWLHFQNYLILPGIIYWTTVVMLYLNPFGQTIKQVFITISTISLAVVFWYLKTVFLSHKDAKVHHRQLIFLAKLLASYLAFAGAFGVTRYFGYGASWFMVAVFALTFMLLYQALFQHHETGFETLKFLFATSLILGATAFFLYYFWNVNYFSGALVLTGIYNTIWGLIHHKWIDKNLSREMVYEYLAVLFVILVIVFSSTNFAQRI